MLLWKKLNIPRMKIPRCEMHAIEKKRINLALNTLLFLIFLIQIGNENLHFTK